MCIVGLWMCVVILARQGLRENIYCYSVSKFNSVVIRKPDSSVCRLILIGLCLQEAAVAQWYKHPLEVNSVRSN